MSTQESAVTMVEHGGIRVESNHENAEQLSINLGQTEPEKTTEKLHVDQAGLKHDTKGRFTGTVKPIKDKAPAPEKKANGGAAPEAQPEAETQEPPAAAQPAKKEAKADADEPTPDDIAQIKADEEEKAQQRRKDAAWRVQQATRQAAQERREREARDAEIAQLRAELQSLKAPAAKPTVSRETAGDGPPDPESFQTVAEYLDARDQWNRRQTIQELRAEQQRQQEAYRAEQQQRQIEKYAREFEAAVASEGALDGVDEELLELRPSFFVQAEGGRPTAENALADEILAAGKNAPRLLRYLSEHQDQLRRIVQAPSPAVFAREMGRVEAQLEAVTSAKPAKPPYKPEVYKPVPAVAGRPHAVEADVDEMSLAFEELARRRMNQGKFKPPR